jgi:hypothetical protein
VGLAAGSPEAAAEGGLIGVTIPFHNFAKHQRRQHSVRIRSPLVDSMTPFASPHDSSSIDSCRDAAASANPAPPTHPRGPASADATGGQISSGAREQCGQPPRTQQSTEDEFSQRNTDGANETRLVSEFEVKRSWRNCPDLNCLAITLLSLQVCRLTESPEMCVASPVHTGRPN